MPIFPFLTIPAEIPGAPIMNGANIQPAHLVLENDAADHWLLGYSAASLIGLVNGTALTPNSTDPTYENGFLVTPASDPGAGLETTFTEAANQTVCMSFQYQTGKNAILMGTLANGSGGTGLFHDNTGLTFQAESVGQTHVNQPSAAVDGSWVFFGMSCQAGQIIVLTNNGVGGPVTISGTRTLSGRAVASGGPYWSSSGAYADGMSLAEFMVFNSTKTASEMLAIASRSQTRMYDRGLILL